MKKMYRLNDPFSDPFVSREWDRKKEVAQRWWKKQGQHIRQYRINDSIGDTTNSRLYNRGN